MINNFIFVKYVDMFYFLVFGDLNGDWFEKKNLKEICSYLFCLLF